ncbi:MFS transporter [Pseudomonas sp. RC3H12]|uniref:MFS transporter n=1 Tax=Pseudomonas sp. RC3H12 TaxID=2834406 RepID=UPI001BDE0EDE|nr:MFS transporter [Pseudomonas sp. RC3H12]QWA30525.1 MFS transporter [Pseudomonas sp. RC3H12]
MIDETPETPALPHGAVTVFAILCGVMVANIYLSQPLLAQIGQSLGVPPEKASLISVASQIGYALGILFVVPLADSANPIKLIRWLMLLTIAGLIGMTAAPGLSVMIAASGSIAVTCVVAQVLIPLATTYVDTDKRGQVVSKLTGGLILGILLSRTLSGISAEYLGSWRAPFAIEAVLVAGLMLMLPRFLPHREKANSIGYAKLLRSLPSLLKFPELRLSMTLSFCTFAGFSAIWATLAFHLASPTFALGSAAAGLFGLWGAPGALLAPYAGRLVDRWGSAKLNMLSLAALMASVIMSLTGGSSSLIALIIAVNLLDFGQQTGQVANQARIFGLEPGIRARLNTVYMSVTFAGGAVGAMAGGKLWSILGWSGVCYFVCLAVLLAMTALLISSISAKARAAST